MGGINVGGNVWYNSYLISNVPDSDSVNEENRSSSPHCPKPDEPEEPLGTAMETRGALKGQSPVMGPPWSHLSPMALY